MANWWQNSIRLIKRLVNGMASKVGLRVIYARHYAQLEQLRADVELLVAQRNAANELLELAIAQRSEAEELSKSIFGVSLVSSDFAKFLDQANLVLPEGGLEYLLRVLRQKAGQHGAQELEHQLSKTKYRSLFEQLFAPEALACSYLSSDGKAFRSPMALGKDEIEFCKRRNIDISERFERLFDITDRLLWELLPDDLFPEPPRRICEIGGGWGSTIKHLKERFSPDIYYNYDLDQAFAQLAADKFGITNMPVDGETLRGTESDSIDLVIANNVFLFVPPVKVWSYLREMKRVVRKGGLVVFNAVQSGQLSERDLDHYLLAHFPKRALQIVPSDIIKRIFAEPQFKLLHASEYCVYRRIF